MESKRLIRLVHQKTIWESFSPWRSNQRFTWVLWL